MSPVHFSPVFPDIPSSPKPKKGHVHRSSLTVSPAWDRQTVDIADYIKVAEFPLEKIPMLPDHEARVGRHASERIMKMERRQSRRNVTDAKGEEPAIKGDFQRTGSALTTDSSTTSNESTEESEEDFHLADDIWEGVPMGPADSILGIATAFRKCQDERKVNVCVGAYRDEQGKPYVLPSVRAAERLMLESNEIKEYLPIEGDYDFVTKAMRFAYGKDMVLEHLAAVQTLSGTGACCIGGRFLAEFWPKHPIYVPTPTWGNHLTIFKKCGLCVRRYRYYHRSTNAMDLEGMLEDLKGAPDGSIILLHACAHNPTGCDPTIEEWKQIIALIREKQHVAFFDSAYQGFASGDAEKDAQPFRYAVSQHVPILLAQSFAKNFGLYGERCGTLSIVCGDDDQRERILSELRLIIRPMYSSPPRHGSSIVKTVLGNDDLKKQYYKECAGMARRIAAMRTKLVAALKQAGSKHDWSHIATQIGMFAFTGLSEDMCLELTAKYAIFLTTNGRISMAGLNDSNLEYVATAIHAVSDGKSITG